MSSSSVKSMHPNHLTSAMKNTVRFGTGRMPLSQDFAGSGIGYAAS